MTSPGANFDQEPLLSIGEVGEATGLSPHTIRVWERRYGRPQAVRLPSGHRRYTTAQVVWLRRVAEALANGHRPGKVLKLSEDELAELVAQQPGTDLEPLVRQLMDLVYASDSAALADELNRCWRNRGARITIFDAIVPLIFEVGRAWQEDRMSIAQEHQLTEVLQDLLRGFRGQVIGGRSASSAEADRVILATLTGERARPGAAAGGPAGRAVWSANRFMLGVDLAHRGDRARLAARCRARRWRSVCRPRLGGTGDRLGPSRHLRRESAPEDERCSIGGRGARRARRGVRDVVYLPTLGGVRSCGCRTEYGLRAFDETGS